MATLEQVRTALEAAIEDMTAPVLAGSGGLKTYWRGRESSWRNSHVIAFLGTPATLGRDEIVMTYRASPPATLGQEYSIRQEGARIITLELQVHAYHASGGVDAREYTARIRNRMLLPSICDQLRLVGVSWGNVAMDRDLSALADNREETIAQIDVRLNAISSEADVPTTWIEWVEAETDFTPDVVPWSGTMKVG